MRKQDHVYGREHEMELFEKALHDAERRGLTIIVDGPEGMGKSALLRKFISHAENHKSLDCTVQKFRMSELNGPDKLLELLIHETFRVARPVDGKYLFASPSWKNQVKALLGVVRADRLFESLLGERWNPSWESLLKLLKGFSVEMNYIRRFLIFIDPEKYLHKDSGPTWVPIMEGLPPKFLLVFAQRPDDVIASCPDIVGSKVRRIPANRLTALDEIATQKFIEIGLSDVPFDKAVARKALERYGGYPYAIDAGLKLLREGTPPKELPGDPYGLAEKLLKKLYLKGKQHGVDLVQAIAVMQVPVSMEILKGLLNIKKANIIRGTLGDSFINGLITESNGCFELYHSLFADAVQRQLKNDGEWKVMHKEVGDYLRLRLDEDQNDVFALSRLPMHVRESEGEESFIRTVISQSNHKINMGMLADVFADVTLALEVAKAKEDCAVLFKVLGNIHSDRGDLDGAFEAYNKALAINQELGQKGAMAKCFTAIGCAHDARGEWNDALEMHSKALVINQEVGNSEGIAINYNNLGVVYKASGGLAEALEMYGKSLAISQQLGRNEVLAATHFNMGEIYRIKGDLVEALGVFGKSLAISQELGHIVGMAKCYTNIGVTHHKLGDLDEALDMYDKALAIGREMDLKEIMAHNYKNIGIVHKLRGDLDEAKRLWIKSINYFRELNNEEEVKQLGAMICNCNWCSGLNQLEG